MPRKSRYTKTDVERELPKARSYRDLLIRLGMCGDGGGNVYSLRKKVDKWGLDDSHFRHQGWLKGQSHDFNKKAPLKEMLKKGSPFQTGVIKKRLRKEGLLGNVCAECGLGPEWNGRELTLVLDHINGIRDDHRLGNLRTLCPNCNSQQSTFAGRNKARPGGEAGKRGRLKPC